MLRNGGATGANKDYWWAYPISEDAISGFGAEWQIVTMGKGESSGTVHTMWGVMFTLAEWKIGPPVIRHDEPLVPAKLLAEAEESLRDRFAMAAAPVFLKHVLGMKSDVLANISSARGISDPEAVDKLAALFSYVFADAMMEASKAKSVPMHPDRAINVGDRVRTKSETGYLGKPDAPLEPPDTNVTSWDKRWTPGGEALTQSEMILIEATGAIENVLMYGSETPLKVGDDYWTEAYQMARQFRIHYEALMGLANSMLPAGVKLRIFQCGRIVPLVPEIATASGCGDAKCQVCQSSRWGILQVTLTGTKGSADAA